MSLSNKYNIPEETFNKMVRDGVVNTKCVIADEIFELYKSIKSACPEKTKSDIYYQISDIKKMNYFTL
jgi:hypothetical protein